MLTIIIISKNIRKSFLAIILILTLCSTQIQITNAKETEQIDLNIDLSDYMSFSIKGNIRNPIKRQEEGKAVIEFTAEKVHIIAINYVAYRGLFVFINDWFTSETIVVPLGRGENPDFYHGVFKGIFTKNFIFGRTPLFIIDYIMAQK
jgi:hypothetical protein